MSNDYDDEDEIKITDKAEGDEDEEMDYTTSQLYDDVDIRLNEPVAVILIKRLLIKLKVMTIEEMDYNTSQLYDEIVDYYGLNLNLLFLIKVCSRGSTILLTPTLLTVPGSVIFDSSQVFSTVIPQSLPSFTSPPPTTTASYDILKSDLLISYPSSNASISVFIEEKQKKTKDEDPSLSGSSKGDKSQSKSSGKSVQSEEPEFEVADSDMPQDQEENLGKDDKEPKVWLMTLASSAKKLSKTFDELMSTPIDFSAFIMNGLKINNLTQETLLGPAFRLLKGTRSNYAELEYDFEECYKALSEKLDWENPEGGDYPFDLTKPLPLVMSRNRQKVPVDYFFNNDLKYLQGGISTMTYTTSLTKTKAAQYDLAGIEDMTFYAYARGLQSRHDVYSTKRILAVTHVEVMRKHGYGYLKEIVVRRADNILYRFKEGDFPRLRINDIEDMLLLVVQNRLTNLSGEVMTEMWNQNRRDLPRDIPLDSVVVLMYDKRSKSENKGKVPTEMKLVLEQTQQGTSYEVSASTEGVEELKRKVKIKGGKKEALFTLSMKVKENQERCIIKAFKLSYQEKYEHVSPKSQDHKMARLQDDVKRLCLVDDLKKFKITFMSSQRYKSKPEVYNHYIDSQVKD
ncbi:hypothetical protein Tco_1030000 [Tanacetum coccineum]|uniref:Uncharacterized protein n=1 Tax=Tanacetum coccineum TaxID=301880 RepID=A0ABQ5G6R0_9ASTR